MRHCHFHFFRKIRFSLCLSLFLIGLGIFCAAVCKCADSDTWIVQFLTNPQADSGKSSSDASSENTTALNAAFTENRTIAMAYVPWQQFRNLYDLEQALQVGTIFAELDKPFTGRGGMYRENCM